MGKGDESAGLTASEGEGVKARKICEVPYFNVLELFANECELFLRKM
jgi:hypothetical protein